MNSRKILAQIDEALQKATESKLSEVFPKVLTIAKYIGDKDFEKWLLLEMSGYLNTNSALTDEVKVPSYRMIAGQFRDRYGRFIVIEDPELYKIVSQYPIREGISELEVIADLPGDQANINPIWNSMINKSLGLEVSAFIFRPFTIKSVLSEVRGNLINKLSNQREALLLKAGKAINVAIPIELSNLHPTVQNVAGELFGNGHYRQAILDTYIALVNAVKIKSGKVNLDNTGLMQSVFSVKNPALIISSDPDEQLGFMWLYSGAVMAIRNPKAHRLIEQNDPQRALEWLSFASVLLRVLDDSETNP